MVSLSKTEGTDIVISVRISRGGAEPGLLSPGDGTALAAGIAVQTKQELY